MLTYDEGIYDAEILDQSFGQSGRGTPYWNMRCRVLARLGPDGRTRTCPVQERDVRYYTTERSAGMFEEALAILGVTEDQIFEDSPTYTPLAGRRVLLRCRHDTSPARPREEWWVTRPPASSAAAAAKVAAVMAARRAAKAAATPTTTASDPPVPPVA